EVVWSVRVPQADVHSLAFHPEGRLLATGVGAASRASGEIVIWDTSSGQRLMALQGHTRPVGCVAYSPDGPLLASASIDGTVMVWEAASGRSLLHYREHSGVVHWVVFSPDSRWLASASEDAVKGQSQVKVWNPANGKEAFSLRNPPGNIAAVVFRHDA